MTSREVTTVNLPFSFAKNLIDVGVSMEKIATLQGHSNLNTTRIYIMPGVTDLEDAVEAVAEGV